MRRRFCIFEASTQLVCIVGSAWFLAGCAVVDRAGILPGLREDRLENRIARVENAVNADAPYEFPHSRRSVREAESLLDFLDDAMPPRDWTGRLSAGRYELVFDNTSVYAPEFSRVLTPRSFPRAHEAGVAVRPGLGLPVILVREAPGGDPQPVSLVPPNDQSLPKTIRFSFEPAEAGRTPLVLSFDDPHDRDELAANFSAAAVRQISPSIFRALRFRGLINPWVVINEMGLYALQPYDPRRIPVVFIHGLNSDPHIWTNAVNGILIDPALRRRYQIWYFQYPTGLAVLGSASRLREALLQVRATYDPENDDAAFDRTVLVGHSMGGLLARMQAIDSGDRFRKAHFRSAIDDLMVDDTWRERLRAALEFSAVPFVSRLVFISTPHRGSDLADLNLARLFEQIIRIPRSALNMAHKLVTLNVDELNPALMRFRALGMSSVQTLSPRHPYFKALEQSPIEVPFHSIIGVRRATGDPATSSDGVVPYWSSHLEGAESEVLVPYGHGNVERRETVSEVLRILRLHAGLCPLRPQNFLAFPR